MKGLFGFFRGKNKEVEKVPAAPEPPPPPAPAPAAAPPPAAPVRETPKAEEFGSKLAKINSILLEEEEREQIEPIATEPTSPVSGDSIAIEARHVLDLFPEGSLKSSIDEIEERYGAKNFSFSFSRSEVMYGLSLGRLEFTIGDLVSKFPHNVFGPGIQEHFNDKLSVPLRYVVPKVPPAWLVVRSDQDTSRERILGNMDDLFSGSFSASATPQPSPMSRYIEPEPEAATLDIPPEPMPARPAAARAPLGMESESAMAHPPKAPSDRKPNMVYVPAEGILAEIPEECLRAPLQELLEEFQNFPDFEFAFTKDSVLHALAGGRMSYSVASLANDFQFDVFGDLNEVGHVEVMLPLSRIVPKVPTQWFARQDQDLSREQKIKHMDDIFTGLEFPSSPVAKAPAAPAAPAAPVPVEPPTMAPPLTHLPDPVMELDDEPVAPTPAPEPAAMPAPAAANAPAPPVEEEVEEEDEEDTYGRRTVKIQRPGADTTPLERPETPSWAKGQPVLKLKRTGSALPLKPKTLLPGEVPSDDEVLKSPGQQLVRLKRKTEAAMESPPAEPPAASQPPAPAAADDSGPGANVAVAALMERLRKGQRERQTEASLEAPKPPAAAQPDAAKADAAEPAPANDLRSRILQLGRRAESAPPAPPAAPVAPPVPAPAPEPVEEAMDPQLEPQLEESAARQMPAEPAAEEPAADYLQETDRFARMAPEKLAPEPEEDDAVADEPVAPVAAPALTPIAALAEDEFDDDEDEIEEDDDSKWHEPAAAAALAAGLSADEMRDVAIEVLGADTTPKVHSGVATSDESAVAVYHSQAPNGIDINRCDEDRLCMLAGVGMHTAQQIIHYRQAHGNFQRLQDLMEVSGLGSHTYRSMTGLSTRASLRASELRVNELLGLDGPTIHLPTVARAITEQLGLVAFFITGTEGMRLAQHASDPAALKLADSLCAVAPQLYQRGQKTLAQAKLPDAEMFTFYVGKRAVTFAGADQVFCACIHQSPFPNAKQLRQCQKLATELSWYCSFRAVV